MPNLWTTDTVARGSHRGIHGARLAEMLQLYDALEDGARTEGGGGKGLTRRFTFTLPVSLHARYKAEAKERCMSMAALILQVLMGLQAAPKGEK